MTTTIDFNCNGRLLRLDRPRVMGVMNITSDSFYEGSRVSDDFMFVAERMVKQGAAILDIGGESTRPSSAPVREQEEVDRVAPVIERIRKHLDVIISVDTSSAMVMKAAVKAGAGIINDVRALQRDGALEMAAQLNVPVILMHSLINNPEPGFIPHYTDVVAEVGGYLQERIMACEAAGIVKERIILDPGFGGGMFGKLPVHDLTMLHGFERFHKLGFPLLAGMSRKSFIGATLERPDAKDRLAGSLAVAMLAAQRGAKIIRVHDVAETVDVLRMLAAVDDI